MKEIKLSKGMVALVDDTDYEYINQWSWYAIKVGRRHYAVRKGKRTPLGRENFLMHRVIMDTPIGLEVDHIDHDGLNNQRYNLRNCTHRQNIRNKRKQVNNKTGYVGVRIKKDKKFNPPHIHIIATITLEDRVLFLGSFKTIKQAAIAYDNAAIKYFGEFANLNFKDA
jgi:hypothetical protein